MASLKDDEIVALIKQLIASSGGGAPGLIQFGAGQIAGAGGAPLAAALGPTVAGFTALNVTIGQTSAEFEKLERSAIAFSQFANPAQVMRLQRAQEDLSAAFGVILLPIVDMTARSFDRINALITRLQPVLEPVIQELANAFEEVIKQGVEVAQMLITEFQPEIQQIAQMLRELAKALIQATHAATEMYAISVVMIDRIKSGRILDILNPARYGEMAEEAQRRLAAARAGGAITIAARPAQYIATEEIGRQARLAAFGARSLQQQMIDQQQQTNAWLEQIAGNTAGGIRGPGAQGSYIPEVRTTVFGLEIPPWLW